MVDIAEMVLRADSGQFMEAAGAMDEVANSSRRTAAAVGQSEAALDKTGRSGRRLGGAFNFLNMHNRQLRGAMQNTAFQLQDIIVQLEMGVPLSRTLAQQLPQLAGSFGAVGAGIGAVVGAMFAFGPLLVRSGEKSKGLEKDLSELTKALDSYKDAAVQAGVATSSMLTEVAKASRITSIVAGEILDAEQRNVEARMKTMISGLRDTFSSFFLGGDQEVFKLLGADYFEQQEFGRGGPLGDEIREFVDILKELETRSGLENQLDAAIRLREQFQSMVDVNGDLTEKQQAFVDGLAVIIQELEVVNATIDSVGNQWTAAETALFHQTQLRIQAAQKGIAQEDAAREKAHWDEFARIQFRIQAVQQGVAREAADRERMLSTQQALMVSTREEAEGLANELFQAFQDGEQLAGLNIASGINAAAIVAGVLAQRLGISLAAAQGIVALGQGAVAGGRGGDPRQFENDPYWRGRYFPDPQNFNLDAGGGGGDSGLDPLERIQEEIRRRERALEVGRKELELLEAIWDIEDRLGDDREKHSDEYIANLAREMLALEEREQMAEDMRERLDQIGDTMKSAMEDAFMSMIDGTKSAKEAFKDMARSIIAELFRVLVVQQLVGNFEAGGGGILGSLFKGLNFEGGGNTPSGPRTGGLDGRGGMLAMVHPNETIIDNTRPSQSKQTGAAQETIIVKQDINVTTGVQQTVRAEILALMPRIAEHSKMAVLDAKQRGGAFGKAL